MIKILSWVILALLLIIWFLWYSFLDLAHKYEWMWAMNSTLDAKNQNLQKEISELKSELEACKE